MQDLLNIGRDILAVVWGLNCLLLVLATLFAIVCVPIFKNHTDYKGFLNRVFEPLAKVETFLVKVVIYLGW